MIDFGLLLLFFLCVQFRDRFFLPAPLIEVEIPALELPLIGAAFLFALLRIRTCATALNNKVALLWAPYLLLGVLLPGLGIVFGDYKLTTLYAVIGSSVLPFASLLIGIAAFTGQFQRKIQVVHWVLNAGVVLQFALSMLQFARLMGYSNPLITLITEWDVNAQARLKEEYVIVGRSIGSYISPNVLGVWAMAAYFWNIVYGKGFPRVLFSGLSLITLILSQSRGSGFALVAATLFYLAMAFSPARSFGAGGIKAIFATSFLTVVGLIALAFIIPDFTLIPGIERWQGGLNVISSGSQADANFAGRIEVWREAFNFMREYPLGTFGPPQILFILPPDNLYVHLLLQGSVFFVASFLIGLAATFALCFRGSKEAILVSTFSVAIAVNSVSALPLFYSPGLLFWFFLGCYLSSQADNAEMMLDPGIRSKEDMDDLPESGSSSSNWKSPSN